MDIKAAVIRRLETLGYTGLTEDIDYAIERAEAMILIKTNQKEVPEGLFYVWADMAAGLFLKDLKLAGGLDDTYDFSGPAKSISEGDTSITFARTDGDTFEAQFDDTLERMINPPAEVFVAYRRLVW